LENFEMVRQRESDPSQGVYGISVAASLVGNAPQNLRLYEARGLLEPARSDGGTRLYSENDLERLRVIAELLDDGLNLAGVHRVLDLQETNERLQGELDRRAVKENGDHAQLPAPFSRRRTKNLSTRTGSSTANQTPAPQG
jgi:MerR family transcriptional regulator/heat shock protein HspR